MAADGDVSVIALEMHGSSSATLTYRTSDGRAGRAVREVGLDCELMSHSAVEAPRTGNPFAEKPAGARVDQLARATDLKAKLAACEWDLVIFDEAHKLAAPPDPDETADRVETDPGL